MSDSSHGRPPIEFSIDGELHSTEDHKQTARALLELAGLDPSQYDLGELKGERPKPKRFEDDEEVTIHPGARYVSIRHAADVA